MKPKNWSKWKGGGAGATDGPTQHVVVPLCSLALGLHSAWLPLPRTVQVQGTVGKNDELTSKYPCPFLCSCFFFSAVICSYLFLLGRLLYSPTCWTKKMNWTLQLQLLARCPNGQSEHKAPLTFAHMSTWPVLLQRREGSASGRSLTIIHCVSPHQQKKRGGKKAHHVTWLVHPKEQQSSNL